MSLHSIDLAGATWQFAQVTPAPLWQSNDLHLVHEWLPATVPGNVESDLLAAGRIPDPYSGSNLEQIAWVHERDWWYRCSLDLPLARGQRAHLVLHGVDYYSAVYANGACLGQHEGMFSRQVYEVTNIAQAQNGHLDIAVRVWGAHALPQRRLAVWQRLADPLLKRIVGPTDMFPARLTTQKCQMSFGWDFAPRLPTAGIWDDAEIVLSGPVFIDDVWVRAVPQGNDAHLAVRVGLDSIVAGPGRFSLRVEDADTGTVAYSSWFDVQVARGPQSHDLAVTLPSARRWQPWQHGQPQLYRLTVEVHPPAGGPPTASSTTCAVRSVEMDAAKNTLSINGHKEFLRGVNWVPLDALPGRVRPADYAQMISLAKQANVNILRVWGGGLREKRAFYDLCDREGILIWQEFPLACPHLLAYPRDDRFLDLVTQEATAIVRALRNHPSVVLWCGGNEFSPRANHHVVKRLAAVVAAHDGTRPFRPASPAAGDRHNWRVWHRLAPVADYTKERAPLVSEFGLQSAPALAALRRFIPEGELWPAGPAWTAHNAELGKLRHYASPFLPSGPCTASDFVRATQMAQGRGIQVMVEHMRRRKGLTSGVMVWQFNEPWPSICWSVVDYWREPKLGYHVLRRVFNPLLISLEYKLKAYRPGDTVPIRVWLISDEKQAVTGGRCVVRLLLNGNVVHEREAEPPVDSSCLVGEATITVPSHPGPWLLRAELRQDERLLSDNEYDLAWADSGPMPLLHRLIAFVGQLLLQ